MKELTIRDIRARAVIAPISRLCRTASGVIEAAPLVLIDVETDGGVTGCAYAFGYSSHTLKPMMVLIDELRPELIGKPLVPYARMQQIQQRFRLLGLQGLLGMVASTLDMAYWDALGKASDQAVVQMLGGDMAPIRAYDSYGMVDPVEDAPALKHSLDQGFRAIKIKIGYDDPKKDVSTVRAVRALIGKEVALMIDFNQSLSPADAIRRIRALQEFDLYWIEEPVAAEDLQGHEKVRVETGASIQTGENWWFPRDAQRAIAAGASDRMMPDLMKIGGITGWLSVIGIASAASMPVSSHLFIEASAHVLAVTPTFDWLEFMDFGSGVLAEPNAVTDGCVSPKGPGLGIVWNESEINKYQVK